MCFTINSFLQSTRRVSTTIITILAHSGRLSATVWSISKVEEMYILQACIPLCCKVDADLGSEGGRHLSGQEEVGEVLIFGRTMFPEMKSPQQQKEDDLFWQKITCIYDIWPMFTFSFHNPMYKNTKKTSPYFFVSHKTLGQHYPQCIVHITCTFFVCAIAAGIHFQSLVTFICFYH